MITFRKKLTENKGCEHCRIPYNNVSNGQEGKDKAILYFTNSQITPSWGFPGYLNYMDDKGIKTIFEVSYCPWCGRKLEVAK